MLIPCLCCVRLCSSVKIDLALDDASFAVAIRSEARTTGQTGVEMEALTGAAVAALTVIDMVHHVPKHLPSQPVSTAECCGVAFRSSPQSPPVRRVTPSVPRRQPG